MLSGKPAFREETVTDTLAAIVRGEPDMELPAGTPRKIRRTRAAITSKQSQAALAMYGRRAGRYRRSNLGRSGVINPTGGIQNSASAASFLDPCRNCFVRRLSISNSPR